MAQEYFQVNNYHDSTSRRNTISDVAALYQALFKHEGIIQGCQVKAVPTNVNQVRIYNGFLAIDIAEGLLVYELADAAGYITLDVPGLGVDGQYFLVAFKLDLDNLTTEFVVVQGDIATDPTLTEGGSPEIYYLPIARIADDGDTVITNDEIQATYLGDTDYTTITSGSSEVLGRFTEVKYEATTMPFISMEKLANQAHVASATFEEILWNDVKDKMGDIDANGYNLVSGEFTNFRPGVNTAGYYMVRIGCRHSNGGGQLRDVRLRVTETVSAVQKGFARQGGLAVGTASSNFSNRITRLMYLAAGAELQVDAYSQDAGTRGQINGQNDSTYIELHKVI